MLFDDGLARSLASYIPIINKQTDVNILSQHLRYGIASPEVIKLNQSVCNDQKARKSNIFFSWKNTVEKEKWFISCQPIKLINGLYYRW